MTTPAIIKILAVFCGMLGLSRFGLPLGLALVIGGVFLDAWAGSGAALVLRHFGIALSSPLMWLFIGVTMLVVEVGEFMTRPENASTLLGAVRRWGGRHGRAWSLMALPAVFGLVPMPAGALVSAPLVEQAAPECEPDWKTAVNYWFRHSWEFWWPLYPGVIVAMSIFGIETWLFLAAQAVYTPVTGLIGYRFLIRPHRGALAEGAADPAPTDHGRVALLLLPIGLVVVGTVLLPSIFQAATPSLSQEIRKMLAMLASLVVALALIMFIERGAPRRYLRALAEKKSLQVYLTVAGVLTFKSMMDSSLLLPAAGRDLVESGIPLACAVAVLPLLAGLVTGIAVGFTGASFPLVVGLMNTPGSGLHPLETLTLAYGFGHVGMMLSPVHLCLIMSRDYFASSASGVYRLILPCVLSVATVSILLHLLFRLLAW